VQKKSSDQLLSPINKGVRFIETPIRKKSTNISGGTETPLSRMGNKTGLKSPERIVFE